MDKEIGFYRIEVEFFDGDGEHILREGGWLMGRNYASAAAIVEKFYGSSMVSMTLYALEPASILLDEDIQATLQGGPWIPQSHDIVK